MQQQGSRDPLAADEEGLGIQNRFVNFLSQFTTDDMHTEAHSTSRVAEAPQEVYLLQLKTMLEEECYTLNVNFQHVISFDPFLAEQIVHHYYRFEPYLRRGLKAFVREHQPSLAVMEETGEERELFVAFANMSAVEKVRSLNSSAIGKLVSIKGTVTRTSEVRPELLYGVFSCVECGTMSVAIEQQFKYTEPTFCRNPNCNNRNKWKLDIGQSVFVDWQRLKVQENADEIPPGSMPRTVDVVVRQQSVEVAKAGDKCVFTGTLIVIPDIYQMFKAGEVPRSAPRSSASQNTGEGVQGLRNLGVRDLTYRTAFLAGTVVSADLIGSDSRQRTSEATALQDDIVRSFTEEERVRILEMSRAGDVYRKLARSIAPTVFGHEDIKRGLLLQYVGGVHKVTKEKMRLRGDINVCVVGDPSTAKSQFLKYTHRFIPRCVYTSGKASSAAGLTASVAKDSDTGEFTIEAGALMLADNGICCIDEFDKMDPADQVAIHEAMEQQTISITKAGIQATLNARASILAAANPVFGRYDRSKTLRQNVAISPALMSRFDLFFVVLDDCNETEDFQIAHHIVSVHQGAASLPQPDYDSADVLRYIQFARTVNPRFTVEAVRMAVSCYRRLRQADVGGAGRTAYRITVRQLESMIRLCEALARLQLQDEIQEEHVKEAFRLLRRSIVHVREGDVDIEEQEVEFDQAQDGGAGGEGEPPESKEEALESKEDSAPQASLASLRESAEQSEGKKKELKIPFTKFKKIRDLVVWGVRSNSEVVESGGMRVGDLIEWVLDALDIQDEEELEQELRIVRRVVARLIKRDNVLVVVSTDKEGDDREVDLNPDIAAEE